MCRGVGGRGGGVGVRRGWGGRWAEGARRVRAAVNKPRGGPWGNIDHFSPRPRQQVIDTALESYGP